jgi:hypothetical protein
VLKSLVLHLDRTPPTPGIQPPLASLLARICVRPPYFNLRELALDGLRFAATSRAEAPPFLEIGAMTAAELGRHAAIAGASHGALSQGDDKRRYYLARHAECRYTPNPAPYGTPVRFASQLESLGKRDLRALVTASAAGAPLAEFTIDYAILTEATFERLFRSKAQPSPSRSSPYGHLLSEDYQRGADWLEQRIDAVPVAACAGHFEGYPALPVAVLMGQLSYLAGRLVDDEPRPFRVVRGSVSADDLAWAGEAVHFCVRRTRRESAVREFACEAFASGRPVGHMALTLELVDEQVGLAPGSGAIRAQVVG